jgi:hypothetical protein
MVSHVIHVISNEISCTIVKNNNNLCESVKQVIFYTSTCMYTHTVIKTYVQLLA